MTSLVGPAPPGRRERKKLATRTAIRDAALRLAVRHGVENVTVERIATEADVAVRTFFNHFSSKEEAVLATMAAGAAAFIAEFRERPPTESVLRAVREAVLAVMDQSYADNGDHIESLRLIRDSPALLPQQLVVLTAQEKALAEAVAGRVGLDPGDAYPAVCAAATLATLRVSLDRWLDRSPPTAGQPALDDLRAEVDQALDELGAGLDR